MGLWSRSALHEAFVQATDPDADLSGLLAKIKDKSVRTPGEAKAICDLLRPLHLGSPKASDQLHARLVPLCALFRDVATGEALRVLAMDGIPELNRIFDLLADAENDRDPEDLLYVLKILARYRADSGADRVIAAARKPLRPEAYMWTAILNEFDGDHPQTGRVFKELSAPFPRGFMAMALLDSANKCALENTEFRHPFDTVEGVGRLKEWLECRDEELCSYAYSAAAAIPFLSRPARDALLALALDHPEVDIQLEAAWASGRIGSESGLTVLARYCLDVNYSRRAKQYLTELGRVDRIPVEANESDFLVRSEFASWLAHPNELGRVPDEVEIVDHRQLAWPPEGGRELWLVKYRVKDETGLEDDEVDCGLVGSTTFCLFSYKMAQRPPEDAYAIHCFWELANAKLIHEVDVAGADVNPGAMFGQWQGDRLLAPELVHVVRLSPELNYPQDLVAMATATLEGCDGWVVLDGPRSRWYPKREMPGASEKCVLMLHVGRVLLRFEDQPDRRAFLLPERPKRDARGIIEAYERLLAQLDSADPHRRRRLLDAGSPLGKHFASYVEAQACETKESKAQMEVETYEVLLRVARAGDEGERKRAMDSFGPIGNLFDTYVGALVATGLSARGKSLIEEFTPLWNHNLGYGRLGTAAFRLGYFALAEDFFTRIRQCMKDWCRSETMGLLAEIWLMQGRADQARALLLECLKKVLSESGAATRSDRHLFEKWFQQHRSAYLRLFPDESDAGLSKDGIPLTTLR